MPEQQSFFCPDAIAIAILDFIMISELEKILTNFNYQEGLTILSRLENPDSFIIKLLSKGEDSFNRKKLISKLEDHLEFLQAQEKEISSSSAAQEQFVPDQIEANWKDLYKRANFLFSRISLTTEIEDRKQMAFEILNLMDQVEVIFESIDFRKKFGVLPDYPDKGIEGLTDLQKATRINTLRTYISKARKKDPDSPKIKDFQFEINQLTALLNG